MAEFADISIYKSKHGNLSVANTENFALPPDEIVITLLSVDAYKHRELYIIYRDSLNNEENTQKTIRTQMSYDFDKKESSTKAEQEKKDAITHY